MNPNTPERKELRCEECGNLVDKDGDTIDSGHCSECVHYSSNSPCGTCGFMACDESC